MRAAMAVPCKPGDTVVDLCAAPGTKTTWLAEAVQPDGQVFAYDIDEQRLARIAENAQRLQLTKVIKLVASANDLPVADCVLADVPCSNSGVTSTVAKLVWRFPSALNGDTRARRCVPR